MSTDSRLLFGPNVVQFVVFLSGFCWVAPISSGSQTAGFSSIHLILYTIPSPQFSRWPIRFLSGLFILGSETLFSGVQEPRPAIGVGCTGYQANSLKHRLGKWDLVGPKAGAE